MQELLNQVVVRPRYDAEIIITDHQPAMVGASYRGQGRGQLKDICCCGGTK